MNKSDAVVNSAKYDVTFANVEVN